MRKRKILKFLMVLLAIASFILEKLIICYEENRELEIWRKTRRAQDIRDEGN